MNELPLQQTTKKDEDWKIDSVDAIIDYDSYENNYNEERYRFRDMYDGILQESDYAEVLKPFGKKRKNLGDIKYYNIIRPLVNTLVGEKQKRPINEMVISANADSVSKYTQEKYKHFKKVIFQRYKQQREAIEQGREGNDNTSFEQFEEEFDETYRDERTKRGQHALNYIKYEHNLTYKLKTAFKNFLIEGIVVVYIEVKDDDLYIHFPDPLAVTFDSDSSVDFIEDLSWASIRKYGTWQEIARRFGKELRSKYGEDVIDELQENKGFHREFDRYGYHSHVDSGNHGYYYEDNDFENRIEYFEVFWKSLKKVGIVTGIQPETGQFYEREVEYPYKKLEHEDVEWDWEEEVWQGVRIADSYYINVKPCPVQRSYISKRGAKLPINGKVYADYYNRPISFVSICEPYQVIFNIYMYRLERSIAKARDTIAVFDINFIPDKFDDFDEFFYWMDKTGIAFVDYARENYKGNPQHQSYIDLTVKNIQSYVELLRFTLENLYMTTGVNEQRQGNVGQYSGKSVTDRAVLQSTNNTEDYYFKFAEFQKRLYQGALDYSKAAWLDNKKIHYIGDDDKAVFYELDGIQHLESEYNIFVTGERDDFEDLDMIKQLSQAMIQNGTPISTVAELIRSKNFSKLKNKVKDAEKKAAKRQQEMQQLEKEIAEREQQTEQLKLENENQQREKDRQVDLEKEQIKVDDSDDGMEKQKHIDDIKLKERELQEEERSNRAKEEIERKKINKPNS